MKITMSAPMPTNDDGTVKQEAIAPREVSTQSGNGGIDWSVIPSGKYKGFVAKIDEKTYNASFGKIKNEDSADGKWTYYAVTPHIRIPHYVQETVTEETFTDEGMALVETTQDIISYVTGLGTQDLTVGVVKDNALYRVQQDGKSPFFRGQGSAFDLFQNLGLLDEVAGSMVVSDDLENVRNRVLSVVLGYSAYAKRKNAGYLNWGAKSTEDYKTGAIKKKSFVRFLKEDIMPAVTVSAEATKAFKAWVSKEKWETYVDLALPHIFEIVEAYNVLMAEEWGSHEEGFGIRVKNEVVSWGAYSQEDAESMGHHYAEGKVFVTEDDYTTYKGLVALDGVEDGMMML